jgi:hypothetical protein
MAYERNWAFSINNLYTPTSALDYTRYQMWALKALLCGHLGGLSGGLWTVYSSCDGATAGNADGPGTDRWLASYNGSLLVRGTSSAVRSWIVLRGVMGPKTFYLNISFDGTSDSAWSTYLSSVAPAGGTTTARPTASDEWFVGATNYTDTNDGTTPPYFIRVNMSLSDTGDFIFFTSRSGQQSASFAVMVVRVVGAHPADPYPVFTYRNFGSSNPGAFTGSQLTSVNSGQVSRTAAGALGYNGTISPSTAGATNTPDLLTNKMMTLPAWVMVNAAGGGSWHARGRIPDIFIVPDSNSIAVNAGRAILSNSGALQYIGLGGAFVPCNTVPNFA